MKIWLPFVQSTMLLILIVMVGLLWWSSSLLESKVKELRTEVYELSLARTNLSYTNQSKPRFEPLESEDLSDSSYPNLLSKDPFMSEYLPKTLGETFIPTGFRKEALLGRPEHLHPFNAIRDVSQIQGMCTGNVAQLAVGRFETLTPDLAWKLEARPRKDLPNVYEYWVHLRNDLFWEPLEQSFFPPNFEMDAWFLKPHPVTAHDFKFYFDAVMNPYVSEPKAVSLRSYFRDIESFEVKNSHTFVVRWKPFEDEKNNQQRLKYSSLSLTGSLSPLASFVYQYFSDGQKIISSQEPDIYQKDSIWAQNFSHHWAKNIVPSCGPYVFSGMTEEGITLKRNPHFPQKYAVLVEGIRYRFKESADAIWQDFKAGRLDLCVLSPNQLIEYENFIKSATYNQQVSAGEKIYSLDYVDRCYYYIGWNCQSPLFQSSKVRQALTMAIDRGRIVSQNLNEMAVNITGPLFCYCAGYDRSLSPWPYDPDQASLLLEEEGWFDLNGDGIREKSINGKVIPFQFQLSYFVKSLSSRVIAEYVAASLREIGISCQLHGIDITDLSRKFDDKAFDAIFMGWKLGTPPDDPRQLWHSSGAKEKGSSNTIGFENAVVDEIIERLNYEEDPKTRTQLYHKFHACIHQEAPYTFLYTPKVRLLYRERVKNLIIPCDHQELIPGADIPEPNISITWLKEYDPLPH